jgi:multiple sugar transport system ATP-binding protein
MAQIKLVNLSKDFDHAPAVADINLTVEDRELLVLLGPSGAGKSTLLRLVAGLEEPSGGEIWVGDQKVNALEPKDRNLGLIFPNAALNSELTVRDNIAFGLRLRRTDAEEIERKTREAAEIMGVENLLDREIPDLSAAMLQRVALARAIARDPAALLLDEPLCHLEPSQRKQAAAEIRRLHRELGLTTLYVSHDQDEAMRMGDRVAVMRNGRLQQVGEPLELFNNPVNKFVARQVGRPQINLVEAVLREEDGGMVVDAGGFRLRLPARKTAPARAQAGAPVLLGMRPGDLHWVEPGGEKPPADSSFTAEVESVEERPQDQLVRLRVGSDTLVMVTEADAEVPVPGPVQIVAEVEHVHVFNRDDGMRIA